MTQLRGRPAPRHARAPRPRRVPGPRVPAGPANDRVAAPHDPVLPVADVLELGDRGVKPAAQEAHPGWDIARDVFRNHEDMRRGFCCVVLVVTGCVFLVCCGIYVLLSHLPLSARLGVPGLMLLITLPGTIRRGRRRQ